MLESPTSSRWPSAGWDDHGSRLAGQSDTLSVLAAAVHDPAQTIIAGRSISTQAADMQRTLRHEYVFTLTTKRYNEQERAL